MNTIFTTYAQAVALHGLDDLWNSIRALLRSVVPAAKSAALPRDPIREAASVRAMADAVRNSDPHFAADLYAAADRHEALYGDESAR